MHIVMAYRRREALPVTKEPPSCAHARLDPTLDAVVTDLTPLSYTVEPNPFADVPAHVRAASAVRRHGARLLIVQDDVNALALHTREGGTTPIFLAPGVSGQRTFDETRGNKRHKMDLEACARLPDGRLVVFGSGSTTLRDHVLVFGSTGELRHIAAAPLYRQFRESPMFCGSELNLEGAIVLGSVLRLFQRGNGAPRGDLTPVNATGDLALPAFLAWLDEDAPAPALQDIRRYALGKIGGVPLSFTDAVPLDAGRVAFIACAEASPDATRDGAVLGCRFGIIENDGTVRTTDVRNGDGTPCLLKLEGIELDPDSPGVFDVLADMDRPHEPALLGRLHVRDDRPAL